MTTVDKNRARVVAAARQARAPSAVKAMHTIGGVSAIAGSRHRPGRGRVPLFGGPEWSRVGGAGFPPQGTRAETEESRQPTGLPEAYKRLGAMAAGGAVGAGLSANLTSLIASRLASDLVRETVVAPSARLVQTLRARHPNGQRAGRRSEAQTSVYEAADALIAATLQPQPGDAVRCAALLRRAVHANRHQRPRHAAVALAASDALSCTESPLGTPQRRRALWTVAKVLTDQFISTDNEMELLSLLDDSGLDRVPPFEDTAVAELLREEGGEAVR